jgi:hypothetical protein
MPIIAMAPAASRNRKAKMRNPERPYIETWKALAEEKLQWGASGRWRQRDFSYLSEKIYNETSTLISVSTLKRICRSDFGGTPHPGTLDALARFLGFEDWPEFRKAQDAQAGGPGGGHPEEAGGDDAGRAGGRRRLIFTALAIIPAAAVAVYFAARPGGDSYGEVAFSSRKVVSEGVPNTVVFDYDVTGVDSDDIRIQQSWDPKMSSAVRPGKGQHTSVYYYPGFHRAKLLIDGEAVKGHDIHITTDGWLTLARYGTDDPIPFYIPPGEVEMNGRIHASPASLAAGKFDLSGNSFFVSYYCVRDFGDLQGDDFTIEARLKNDLGEGGLTCQYSEMIVMCENGRMIFPLCLPGCVSNISMKVMDTWVDGRDNDLSALGCDLSHWNDLRCEIAGRKARVSVNESLAREVAYSEPAGRVIGLHFIFFGCGSVGGVRMETPDGAAVFEEDFSPAR